MSEEMPREKVSEGMPQGFSEMLDKVLSNPELIRSVASALASSEPQKNDEGEKVAPVSATAEGSLDKLPQIAELLKPVLSGSATDGKRDCLLGAIKPYVSEKRRDAIDTMIKFSHIAELMKKIN